MSLLSFMAFLLIASMLFSTCSGNTDTMTVDFPSDITALSGSCVQIPCTYNVSNFQDKLKTTQMISGSWLKTTHKMTGLIFNSNPSIIKGFSHIEMVGNLRWRECTTVFYDVMRNHSDVYYFRVQMEPDIFRATFLSPVNIVVLDVPNPPELNVEEVMEGTLVSVMCSAEALCPIQPPTLSWSYIPIANLTTQIQEKPDKTQSVVSKMTFNASYTDHKKNIICTVTYPRHVSTNTTVKLRVQFSPKETHIIIKPNASVSVGTNVTLTCKSKANPSYDMNYTWYKRGEQKRLASGEQVNFNVSRINEGWYFCRAQNKHGAQTSEDTQLIVEGSPESFIPLIAGCVGGALAFLLLCLLATIFIRKQRTQASNTLVVGEANLSDQDRDKDVPINSIYTNGAFVSSEQSEMTKDESDKIHYGEINFSTFQTKYHTEKSSGQEIIYAENTKKIFVTLGHKATLK